MRKTEPTLTLADVRDRVTITVEEAGQLIGLSRAASYIAAQNGQLPTVRIGRRLLVPVPKLLVMFGVEMPQIEPKRDLQVQGHHVGPLA